MKTKFIVLAICFATAAKAQDATFSQFNSVPLYYNPAFAGSAEKSRLAVSYRNQWAGLYQTYYVSYDQAVKKLHGGVGFLMYNDHSGPLNVLYSGLAYAAKFNVAGKVVISPAIKIAYRRSTLNVAEANVTELNTKNGKAINNCADVTAGLLVNTAKLFAGFTIDHLNQPDQSFGVGKAILPIKYIAQLGYTFQKSEESSFSVTPSALYQQQQNFNIVQCNLSFKYKWAVLGLGYTTNSYSLMLGYYSKKIIIGYSFEYYQISLNINGSSPVANEVSLRYLFAINKSKKEPVK